MNNELIHKLKDVETYYKGELKTKKKEISELHEKINDIDKDQKVKLEGYLSEISSLQIELKTSKLSLPYL
mgnify:CR=1 FL=1